MRMAGMLALLLVGFGLGWIVRDRTAPKAPARADRTPLAAEPAAPPPTPPSGESRADEERTALAAAEEPEPEPALAPMVVAAEEPGTGAEPEDDPLARWVKSQGPQWKAMIGLQTGQRIDALLKDLGFDPATAKLIKEAIQEEAERQTDRFLQAMLGEGEPDAGAVGYMMGLPGELSLDLERELGTFLGDGQIGVLREGLRKAHDRQMNEFADMQIKMTGMQDLTDVQRDQLRDVFVGRNMIQEQMTQFAQVTRDRTKLRDLMSGRIDLRAEMEKGFAPRRERVRQFLTPEQFERYKAYEETMFRQAEMGIKMMGSMLTQSGTQAPAGR